MLYVFEDYTLDSARYELRQQGVLVRVEPRAFDVLAYLIQHAGYTVTKEELLEQLWATQFVSDSALTYCVAEARKAIGDSGQAQRCIKTVRGRGYRFIIPVETRLPEDVVVAIPTAPSPLLPAERGPLARADVAPLPHPVPTDLVPVPPPAEAPSGALRATRPGWHEAERRQLTVLCCGVSSAPARAVPLDPEELLEMVQDYHALCTEVIDRFAGHIAQYLPEGLVVYFGYPQAHDDDAHRAVRTGLGIVEGVAGLSRRLEQEQGARLAVRVGIHTGVVVMGALRQGDPREPLAFGETPTIAAQVQSLAAPDAVVVSPTTLHLVEGYFVTQAMGAHILEEAAEPLAVYQILQEGPVQSRFAVAATKGLTPLVGREQEVGLLRERWAQATEGRGQVVMLSGEAGIGKSRLVQVLTEHLTGEVHTHIECQCSSYYQNTAFYPVVTSLQRFLRFTREEPAAERLRKLEKAFDPYGFPREEVVPLLAALLLLPPPAQYPALTHTPEWQKQKTLEFLLAWLLHEAGRQPVCVVMDDLHWGDPSTLEWLSLLIDQIPTTRVLLLLLCRPEFRPSWMVHSHCTHLALGRLSPRQTVEMIEQVVGGKPLPAEVVQQVVAITDGVPLFVEELTKMILESGLVKERAGRYALAGPLSPLAIPATLHDSLMARLDRLGRAKQIAQLGAVVGREFSYEVLQAVAPMAEAVLQQGLAQLVEAELLYQRGLPPQATYRFKHVLIQEVAYQSLLKRTQRQYHQQIAQVLETCFPETRAGQPELLAYHYTEAGLSVQAIPYWQQAGQQARQRSANLEAVQHFTQALALLATFPETPARAQQELDLQLALGSTLIATKGGAAPEVEQTYTRARALCARVGDTPQLFPALWGLYRFYRSQGALPTARELGEQLVQLAEREADPTHRLEAHAALGTALFYLGDYTAARTHVEQGIALTDPTTQRAQALRQGEASGVRCLVTAARTLWCMGYPAQAVQRSQEALTLAQELAHPYSLGVAQMWAAYLHHHRREVAVVQEHAEALLTLATAQGFPLYVGFGTCWRGWALVMQGQSEAGLTQLHQGMSTILTTGQELSRPFCLVLLAEAAGRTGQGAEGLHLLAEALTVFEASGRDDLLAEAYRLQGELLLQSRGASLEAEGVTPGVRLQTPGREAEACFQQALAIARRQQAKSWELRAALSLSRLWQQQGQREAARQLLAGIYDWFTEGFDTADLQEAKALLEELS
jgi:class 3 adenylate cyclase/DNA-binding winged helix-turn-helix (wHTH) protein/predicted ATPase